MRKGVGEARRAAWRLFLAYAVVSLLPLLALAGFLARDSHAESLDRGLEQGRAQSVVVQEMAIAPALVGNDLRQGLTGPEREMLQRTTDLAVYSGSIARLRLRDFDGTVVYSDDGTTVDGARADQVPFRTAASGGLHVRVQPDPVDGSGKVIRSLQPVVATASGRAVGVLELYLPYDEIEADSARHLSRTYRQLAVGVAGLWLVLALISWSSSLSLRRQALLREHEALHDHLTGLPNRAAFLDAVERATAVPERPVAAQVVEPRAAVVLIDLDGFKSVNDTLGHTAGDALLRAVADRLSGCLRSDDVAARLGGDEFALLLPGAQDEELLLARLQGLLAALSAPVDVGGTTTSVGGSVGLVLSPRHGSTVDALMQAADQAMYEAKRRGGGIAVGRPSAAPHSGRTEEIRA